MSVLSRRTLLPLITAASIAPLLRGTPAFAVARDITVTDATGRPIPGADLTIHIPRKPLPKKRRRPRRPRRRKPDLVVRRRTDRTGRTHVPLPPDVDCGRRARIVVRARGRTHRRLVELCRGDAVIRLGGGGRRTYTPPRRRPTMTIGGTGDGGD